MTQCTKGLVHSIVYFTLEVPSSGDYKPSLKEKTDGGLLRNWHETISPNFAKIVFFIFVVVDNGTFDYTDTCQ